MKKTHYVVLALGILLLSVSAYAQYDVPADYSTIQAAINAAPGGSTIHVAAGTYTEAVTVNKNLTIIGVGPTTIVTPPSGVGITVTSNNVTLQSLKVTGATGSGIFANGVSGLTLTSVESDANGTGTLGSGVDVKGITGISVFTDLIANGNHRHGLAIGDGSVGVKVSGGTFNSNGQAGDPSTGGGIIVYADASTTTSGTSIYGTVNANTNKTAGIYLFCDPTGLISSTTIGATGTVTLNDNGSGGGSYGTGGAAVLVYGPCNGTTITANSANSGLVNPTAGLVVLGTDATGSNSPTNTVVKNCTITGASSTSPAGTMFATGNAQTLICSNDVDATVGNDINSFGVGAVGFNVENLLYHKVDNVLLGRFLGPGTAVYVPTGGSINNGIAAADVTYSTVNVQDGTYTENVVVNKAITLNGEGANTIIQPSSGNGVDVTIAGVTIENLHIYLDTPFNGTFAPTALTNTFTFRAQAKVFLQGPYVGPNMSTALLTAAVIPLSQPYNVAPFNYAGGETVVSIPLNVVDWILVELRSGTTGATKTAERAAFLKDDGTVLETDGTPGVWETVAVASGYDLTSYVVIRHRNHLAAMSAIAVALPNAIAYDFTTAQSQAFGGGQRFVSGVGSLYGGDANSDGLVDFNDRNVTLNSRNLSGYRLSDVTMDGTTDFADRNLALNNRNLTTQVP